MKEGPDIARIAGLMGDPARANMLLALLGGQALTASELAGVAGVTVQTGSSHLAKLAEGGLIVPRKQGRHRYFALADGQVGEILESLLGFAASRGHLRQRPGPKDPALRKARICYDHLAGHYGVRMLDSLVAQGAIARHEEALLITDHGRALIARFGIDLGALAGTRRPLCRACLDWSERRSHLAGSLGRALFNWLTAEGLARRDGESRIVMFTPEGERRFAGLFPPCEATEK